MIDKVNQHNDGASDPSIKVGHDVLDQEIAGLKALKEMLSDSFLQSVQLMSECKGRIIVTGMGKSGHVARKIAATFASTGTQAFYVHPGEASHGDLGMIARKDIILALSKSGETPELRDILSYASRFSITLIAMTAGENSTLGHCAKAAIILPSNAEACDITKAPTTSTTMMMALGDALAVALMRKKGVTAQDFHGFHPGGMLGEALRRVEDIMHAADKNLELPLCREKDSAQAAIDILTKGGFGCVGVLDTHDKLIGIVTDGDVRRAFGRNNKDLPVTDIMSSPPKTITKDTIAGDALAMMSADQITSLFVVENNRPIGLLHIHDCLKSGIV